MDDSELKNIIEDVYENRNSTIILALTGRTGSGCTTVANI